MKVGTEVPFFPAAPALKSDDDVLSVQELSHSGGAQSGEGETLGKR
jgi:hypothetical protein